MAKIKLTENQIAMLQKMELKIPKKKMIKITSEQYYRLFESNGSYEYKGQPMSMKPSTNLTKNFKKYGKEIPDNKMKFEGISAPVDIIDFGQNVIIFLKRLLTDPNDENIDRFWKKLGIDKQQLMNKMFEINMLSRKIVNGRKILAIMKDGFIENIKKLYDEIVPKMEEGLIQFGDDIEMVEMDNNDIKNAMKQQLSQKSGVKLSPEQIKKKIAQRRASELERRKKESERPLGEDNYPAGAENDPNAPWKEKEPTIGKIPNQKPFKLLIWEDEYAIFEKDGKYYLFNTEIDDYNEYANYADREEKFIGHDEDGMPDVEYGEWELNSDIIENYFNDNYKYMTFGKGFSDLEEGKDVVEIDQELKDYLISLSKYIKDERKRNEWLNILANIMVSETTTAASSGSFVGTMGNTPIHKGISPSDAMKDLDEENKNRIFNENNISSKEQMIDQMKYNNIMHPNLGNFVIDGIKDKMENDSKIAYVIGLKNDNGLSDSNLLYTYDKNTGKEYIYFNYDYEKLYNAYDLFDDIYALVFDNIKSILRPKDIQEQGIGGSAVNSAGGGAQYDTPGFPPSEFMGTKGKNGKAPVNKGITHKKTMYPKGKMVKVTESQLAKIKQMILESNNMTKTAYPEGGFVEFDDCTKLNNNKEAQNGGCNTGAIDNVVKIKKTKESVVSNEALYYEVAKKTGRTVEEVKKLVESKKR